MTTRKLVTDTALHIDGIRTNGIRATTIVANEVKIGKLDVGTELQHLRETNRKLQARMDFLEEALRYAPGGVEASRAKEHFKSLSGD